jgi:uncharacterized protein (TIRG00374 family)
MGSGRRRIRGTLLGHGLRRVAELTIIALLVEYVLLPQFHHSAHDLKQLVTFDSPWLLLVLGAEAASLAAFARATLTMLPHDVRPSWWRVLRIDLSTIALSHSVPAGGAAGTALGLRLMREADVPVADATFAKVAQGIGSGVVLQVLMLAALATAVTLVGLSPLFTTLAVVAMVVIALVVTIAVLLRVGRRRLAAVVARATGWMPLVRPGAGHRVVTAAADSLDAVLRDRRRLAGAVAWSTANWLLDALALWASVRSFGHSLSFVGLMLPFCIASTLAWIPVTPGGLGFVEAALVPLLVGFGTPKTTALLGLLTWRLVAFWLPIPLGGVAYASLAARSRRMLRPPVPAPLDLDEPAGGPGARHPGATGTGTGDSGHPDPVSDRARTR